MPPRSGGMKMNCFTPSASGPSKRTSIWNTAGRARSSLGRTSPSSSTRVQAVETDSTARRLTKSSNGLTQRPTKKIPTSTSSTKTENPLRQATRYFTATVIVPTSSSYSTTASASRATNTTLSSSLLRWTKLSQESSLLLKASICLGNQRRCK